MGVFGAEAEAGGLAAVSEAEGEAGQGGEGRGEEEARNRGEGEAVGGYNERLWRGHGIWREGLGGCGGGEVLRQGR